MKITRSFIAFFLVVLMLCLPVAAQATPRQELSQAGLAYFNAQKNNQWRKACLMLSRHALEVQSHGSIAGCVDNFATNGFTAKSAKVVGTHLWNHQRRGTVALRIDGSDIWHLNFVRENGVYKLDSDY